MKNILTNCIFFFVVGCSTISPCDKDIAVNDYQGLIIPNIKEYLDRRSTILPIDSHQKASLAALYAGCDYGDWYLFIPIYTPDHEVFLKDISRYVVSLKIGELQGFNDPNNAIKHLQFATALSTLDINGLPISASGIKYLWGLPHLSAINLSNTKVGDGDIDSLMMIETLKKIKIDGSLLTDEGIKELRMRAPEIEILN